ncbi:MAG: hypothetical protein ACRCXL_11545 [Dermatophilaceae bacterium]
MTSDDPRAARRPEVWQPAALRPRPASRPDDPTPPAEPRPPDGPGQPDAAGASPSAVTPDDEGTEAAEVTRGQPGTAPPATQTSTTAPPGTTPAAGTATAAMTGRAAGTTGTAAAGTTSTASSSAQGRAARVSRPLAVFDELSVRPARSAFGRVAAHLRGLVGSDAAPGELTQTWEQQQAPVSTGRRVWVAGGHGGAGTTTLAVCLAQELHARRLDGVALVDAAPGRVGLADRLLRPPQGDVTTGVGMRHERSRSLLSFAPATDLETAERLATDLRRVAGMTLTDAGQRLPGSSRQADAVVVAVECSVRGIGAAGVAVEEATAAGWRPERLLLVLCKPTPTSGVSTVWAMRAVESLGVSGIVLHHDRHLAGAAAIDPGLLAPRTAVDVARVAGHVVTIAAGRP